MKERRNRRERREFDGFGHVAERIPYVGVLELCHGHDISRLGLLYFLELFTLHQKQMPKLLLNVPRGVVDRSVGVKAAGEYPEDG